MAERLWISIPLIPGVQDEAEIVKIADFIAGLSPPLPVRLIPYHRLGESKYAALGLTRPGFSDHTDAIIESVSAIFQARKIMLIEF